MFGDKLLGVAVGFVAVAVFVALPFLVVVAFYVVANIYAVVKGSTFSSSSVNEGVLLTLLIFSVAVIPVALSVGVGLIGRALSPKRQREP